MCYATKRKIADCVKDLMHQKEIRKITIQDIMAATNMSRQSFYYHFKDIYDVLEWIAEYDFAKSVCPDENTGVEDWILKLFHVIRSDKFFYDKVVREVEWPKIVKSVKKPIERQIKRMMGNGDTNYMKLHAKEWQFFVDYFSTSFTYYMLDYIYQRKSFTNEEILRDLHFVLSILEGSGTDYINAKVGVAG